MKHQPRGASPRFPVVGRSAGTGRWRVPADTAIPHLCTLTSVRSLGFQCDQAVPCGSFFMNRSGRRTAGKSTAGHRARWRPALIAAVAAAGLLLWWWAPGRRVRAPIERVVLISIDTCRADHWGCYGHSGGTTPNIDMLAGQGIRFTRAMAPVPLTLPSHSSMFTGQNPPVHGVHHNYNYRLDDAAVTLAEIMQQHAYATGAVLGAFVLHSQYGLHQGFDDYDDHFLIDDGSPADVHYERRAAEVSRLAVQWLAQHADEPFFLFLHYFDPHQSYDPPEPFASRFGQDEYAAEIAYTDANIGLVLEKLKQLNLYDSTLLIVTSDHGEMRGEHGEQTHGFFIYQGVIHVPLVVKLPGRNEPKTYEGTMGLVDLLPTICGLMGWDIPPGVEGVDLHPVLLGDMPLDAESGQVYCESMMPTIYGAHSLLGIVTDRWKYIQTKRPELYDLRVDPDELNNVIAQHPDQARRLEARLSRAVSVTAPDIRDASGGAVNEQTRRSLEALGYVAANVREQWQLDATKDDPKDLAAFHDLGTRIYAMTERGKYEEARQLCMKMIRQRPAYWYGHVQLAKIAEKQGDDAETIAHYRLALKGNPDHVDSRCRLGVALLQRGEIDEAIGHLQRTVELLPGFAAAQFYLAYGLQRAGRREDAIRHFVEGLEIQPDDVDARLRLARILREQGRHDRSLMHYDKLLKLQPDDARLRAERADLLHDMGRES